ncbi:MAG: ABC transporter permease [Candidatus Kapabacteria bacterium]|nr:ABC transporter permease [Candidatus Kapabacteria bacterium]
MKLYLYIARRYIFSFRSFHFISIITFLSIVGITAGVAALICVMSILNGFRDITESQIVGFDPHFRISTKNSQTIKFNDSLLNSIKDASGAESVYPIIQGRVILSNKKNIQPANLLALDPKKLNYTKGLPKRIVHGTFNLLERNGYHNIVVGISLADKLEATSNDTLQIYTPKHIENAISSLNISGGKSARLSGIFRSNVKDYDLSYIFMNFSVGADLFAIPKNTANFIDLRFPSINAALEAQSKIEKLISPDWKFESWKDLNSDLYKVLQFEQMVSFIVLSLIILISAFNVLASLSMTVFEKRRDVSLIKALGADDKFIRKIFISEGIIIGAISTILGVILGLILCFGQNKFGWFHVDETKFIVASIPVLVKSTDIVIIAATAFILSLLATIYPSRRAASFGLIQGLREE